MMKEASVLELTELNVETPSSSNVDDKQQHSPSTSTDSTQSSVLNNTNIIEEVISPIAAATSIPAVIRPPKVAGHFAEGFSLRYMTNLESINQSNYTEYRQSSIITPTGFYQIHPEFESMPTGTHPFRCILSIETLQSLDLRISDLEQGNEGQWIDDRWTLPALQRLEFTVRLNKGRSVFGFSDNEELYVRLLSCGLTAYPPLPMHYTRRMLKAIHKPLVQDVTLALRSMSQCWLATNFLIIVTFQFRNASNMAYYQFIISNNQWFLLGVSSILAFNIFLLRSNYVSHDKAAHGIERLRLIAESSIGYAQNLLTYAALFFPIVSEDILKYAFLLTLLLGAGRGYFRKNSHFTAPVLNIVRHTHFWFLLDSVCYAITAGSFCTLGLRFPINSLEFFFQPESAQTYAEFTHDLAITQVTIFSIALMVQLMRHPYAPKRCQLFGHYASNAVNGIAFALLDNAAIFPNISGVYTFFFGNNISPNATAVFTSYFALQALVVLLTFGITAPSTSNLPEYSLEENIISRKRYCDTRFGMLNFTKKDKSHRHMPANSQDTHDVTADLQHHHQEPCSTLVVLPPKTTDFVSHASCCNHNPS